MSDEEILEQLAQFVYETDPEYEFCEGIEPRHRKLAKRILKKLSPLIAAREREECAKLLEEKLRNSTTDGEGWWWGVQHSIDAIRSRQGEG